MTKIKHRLLISLERPCKYCNKLFYSKDLRRKYCSKECSKLNHRIQVKNYQQKLRKKGYFKQKRKEYINQKRQTNRIYYYKNKDRIRQQQKEYYNRKKLKKVINK